MTVHVHVPVSIEHTRASVARTVETVPKRMGGTARTLLIYGLCLLAAGALLGMAQTLDMWLAAVLSALILFILAAVAALAALVGLIARVVVRSRP